MSDEPGVLYIQAANHWTGREGQRPRYIVIHGTAGFTRASDVGNYFAQASTQASTHYVVGQDGAVVQCVREQDAAWANGAVTGAASSGFNRTGYGNNYHDAYWDNGINPNLLCITIEHVKPHTDNSDQITTAQMQASFKLIDHICQRWNIPRRWADQGGGITGHYSLDPVNRARCPGPYPWDELFTFLKTGGTMIPQGWKDNGTELTAPNGVKVIKGFRDFVLNNNWAANNWPLENEHAQNPLEMSNPALGAGTQQVFRMDTLEWTAERGVFRAYTGQEFLAQRALIASLQKQLADAKSGDVSQLQQQIAALQKQLVDANAWRDKAIDGLKQVGVIVVDLTS